MKICFFLGSFKVNGGIGRVTSMIVNKLSQVSPYQYITLSYFKEDKPNLYPVSESVKQCFLLENYCSMGKLLLTGGVQKLKSFLENEEIDVLVACGALFYPLAVLSCKGTRTRCICWEHTSPNQSSDYRGQRFCRKFGIKHSDINVVLTKSALQMYLEEYYAKNTVQIYNPIDTEIFLERKTYDSLSKKIISVGRVSYAKYYQAAVEVAAKVLPKHPEWSWDIYGYGEEFEEIQNLIQIKRLSSQMHLCGQCSNIYERYQEYSMLVLTSRYEGFPMALLEGMGNGLPLVSFDIETGPNEIIQNGRNGFLVNFDDIETMAERVNELIENRERRIQMSNANLEIVPFFESEHIIQQWIHLFSMLK